MKFQTLSFASQRRRIVSKNGVQIPFVISSTFHVSRRSPLRLPIRCRLRPDHHDRPTKKPSILTPNQPPTGPTRVQSLMKLAGIYGVLFGAMLFPTTTAVLADPNTTRIGNTVAEISDKESKSKKSEVTTKKKKRKQTVEEKMKERRALERLIRKKGRKLDPMKSFVSDPTTFPDDNSPEVKEIMSLWRMDKMKEVTYTQFWQLVRDGHVERARYSKDHRSLKVLLKASAPGGAREVKIGLPYDPDLYNFLLKHNVFIETEKEGLFESIAFMMIRLAFPIVICYCLVQFSFRIGQKEVEDDVFGGANLDMMHAKESTVTFNDIAGIDQIKDEIKEIITFLKNPKRFEEMGAHSPAGILLVGPPGTGKTLLAKAIAGESRVPFFSTAGTEFTEMYVGVGAARVRDMFQKTREAAPCILFIDEFDSIGQRRSSDGSDESVHTINQLLTEMDGFEDNSGVIVVAATNRPSALDTALTRPGRFDRVVHLPLPNVGGRVEILKVHARDKVVAKEVDYSRVARATAGFTGAQLMNLMNQSAVVAVRRRRDVITELDIFDALEDLLMEKRNRGYMSRSYDKDIVPAPLRKAIAIYEAGKVLIGLMSSEYDEVYKVSVCPGGVPTGSTFFLPREDRLESRVVTRAYMESKMVVCLAGRCTERMLLGDANVSTAGASDLNRANAVAKEMIYRCGFNKHLGPVALMDADDLYVAESQRTPAVANISTDIARIAFEECRDLLDAAEAKAYYGLAMNFAAIDTLVQLLLEKETIGLEDLDRVTKQHNISQFKTPFLEGFGWDALGNLTFPGDHQDLPKLEIDGGSVYSRKRDLDQWWDPANPYELRTDLDEVLNSGFSKGS